MVGSLRDRGCRAYRRGGGCQRGTAVCGRWDETRGHGIMPEMMSHSAGPSRSLRARGRVPLLRWAGIAYASLAAAALGWNRSVGHPWAYLDSAAAASGIRWGRDLALGLACAAAVIALSQRLTTRTRWGAAL